LPIEAEAIAEEVLRALETRTPVEPFTARPAGLDGDGAMAVTAALRQFRTARGETQVGRKIGFTNRNIWAEYGVYEPIWGDVYDSTAVNVKPGDRARISHLPQPRIEPEIVLCLDADIGDGFSVEQIAASVGWVAHGFEIVQSIFPDWKFRVEDCVAGNGLHGALLIGPRKLLSIDDRAGLAAALSGISVELHRDARRVDTGVGANVLDGPLQALQHLAGVLARDLYNPALRSGEIVTTGTLTRAFPIAPGERWSTLLEGYDLPGMDIEFY
jgi:2-oxo-3-hexenedioate decarboxylase